MYARASLQAPTSEVFEDTLHHPCQAPPSSPPVRVSSLHRQPLAPRPPSTQRRPTAMRRKPVRRASSAPPIPAKTLKNGTATVIAALNQKIPSNLLHGRIPTPPEPLVNRSHWNGVAFASGPPQTSGLPKVRVRRIRAASMSSVGASASPENADLVVCGSAQRSGPSGTYIATGARHTWQESSSSTPPPPSPSPIPQAEAYIGNHLQRRSIKFTTPSTASYRGSGMSLSDGRRVALPRDLPQEEELHANAVLEVAQRTEKHRGGNPQPLVSHIDPDEAHGRANRSGVPFRGSLDDEGAAPCAAPEVPRRRESITARPRSTSIKTAATPPAAEPLVLIPSPLRDTTAQHVLMPQAIQAASRLSPIVRKAHSADPKAPRPDKGCLKPEKKISGSDSLQDALGDDLQSMMISMGDLSLRTEPDVGLIRLHSPATEYQPWVSDKPIRDVSDRRRIVFHPVTHIGFAQPRSKYDRRVPLATHAAWSPEEWQSVWVEMRLFKDHEMRVHPAYRQNAVTQSEMIAPQQTYARYAAEEDEYDGEEEPADEDLGDTYSFTNNHAVYNQTSTTGSRRKESRGQVGSGGSRSRKRSIATRPAVQQPLWYNWW